MFLLDTNAVISLFRGDPRMIAEVKARRPEDIAISAIVSHELFYGAFRSARAKPNLARVEALRFPVLAFGPTEARRAGQVRAALAEAGTPIGPFDVLIAGQALAGDLTLVTRNVREFERVVGLRLENWEG